MSKHQFWSAARTRRVSISVLCALLLAWSISLLVYWEQDSAIWVGDFPTFYSGAWLVLNSNSALLYNQSALESTQRIFWPYLGGYFPYAYPPFVALFTAPIALLPVVIAKQLYFLISLGLILVAIKVCGNSLPYYSKDVMSRFTALIAFAPTLHALVGGQNLAFSIICYALVMRGLISSGGKADLFLGLGLLGWSFKPHFAILAAMLSLTAGRFRALGILTLGLSFLYLVTALVFGTNWISLWLSAVKSYSAPDFTVNQFQMVSLYPFTKALSMSFQLSSFRLDMLAFGFSILAALAFLIYSWHCFKNSERLLPIILLGPVVVLVSPHTLYYDLGIGLFSLLGVIKFSTDRAVFIAALVWSAVALLVIYKSQFQFSPLVLIAILQVLVAYRLQKMNSLSALVNRKTQCEMHERRHDV